MSGISRDVIALAAILGSAAAAGATTIALSSDRSDDFAFECATTVVETAPRVVVTLGGDEGTFVVAPDVQVHTEEACSNVVSVNMHGMDRAAAEMDRVRARVDRARERYERLREVEGDLGRRQIDWDGLKIELKGLEGVMMMELGGLGELLEMESEGLDEILEIEIEGRLEDEMHELEKQLERLDGGNGR